MRVLQAGAQYLLVSYSYSLPYFTDTYDVYIGDLLEADADAICQQVNCRGAMGAGLAKQICAKWPDVRKSYCEFCDAVGSPYELLGRIHEIKTEKMPFAVINIFGQLNYGKQDVCYTDYNALKMAFMEINKRYQGKTLAFPMGFACGLAGGDWDIVLDLMLAYLPGCRVKIYMK